MQYQGDLYAKIGRKYLKLEMNSDDVDRLEKENQQLKERNQELLESCEGATMMYKDLIDANNIIKYLLEFTYCLSPYKSDYKELKEKAESFLEKYKNIINNYEED